MPNHCKYRMLIHQSETKCQSNRSCKEEGLGLGVIRVISLLCRLKPFFGLNKITYNRSAYNKNLWISKQFVIIVKKYVGSEFMPIQEYIFHMLIDKLISSNILVMKVCLCFCFVFCFVLKMVLLLKQLDV